MLNKIFNLHFTDLCNYKCKHCFVKRERNFLTLPEIKVAIDNISNYFRANNITDGKINIAGGEPTTVLKQQSFHSPPRTFLTYRQLVSTHMP